MGSGIIFMGRTRVGKVVRALVPGYEGALGRRSAGRAEAEHKLVNL